jgi:hypothetical protein
VVISSPPLFLHQGLHFTKYFQEVIAIPGKAIVQFFSSLLVNMSNASYSVNFLLKNIIIIIKGAFFFIKKHWFDI